MDVDVTEALVYLEKLRKKTGVHLTVTHFVGKAVALAIKEVPSLNGRVLFNKFVPYPDISISYLVALEEGKDLGKAKIEAADEKSLADIGRELSAMAKRLREKKDADYEKSKDALRKLPAVAIRPIVYVTGWLASAVGLSVPALGVTPFPFGSAIVTSVGQLGLDEAYVPPTPFCRVPIYVLVGRTADRVVAVDGKPAVRKMMTLTCTIDHRLLDGSQGGKIASTIRRCFAEPHLVDQ